jgi:hypothetical protein
MSKLAITLDLDTFSGCEMANIVEGLGVDNITTYSDRYELLSKYSDEDLIDEITNNNDRDHKDIIVALVKSNILDEDDEQYGLIDKLEDFLKDIGLE